MSSSFICKGTRRIADTGTHLRELIVPVILIASDYVAVLSAIWLAYIFRVYILPIFTQFQPLRELPDLYQYIAIPFAVIFFMHFDNLYFKRLPLWQQTEKAFKVSIYAILLVLTLMYVTEEVKQASRPYMVLIWFFCFVFLALGRYIAKKMLIAINMWQLPLVIIGAGKTGEMLFEVFESDAGLGYKVVGLIEDREIDLDKFKGVPVIGTFSTVVQAVQQTGVKNILIAAPGLAREELVSLIYRLQPYVKNITFIPDLFGIPVGAMELDTLFDEKTVLLTVRNNLSRWYNRYLKRFFDIMATSVGGLIIGPIFVIIALIIYFSSRGPVIFAHKRVGKDGKTFNCYKFCTMVPNSQEVLKAFLAANEDARLEWEQDFKLKNDPRVTKIGEILRKTSLDELPQLINVLKGEMSLVGPRPIVQEEVAKYGDYISDYYLVRPGITGLWQVSGRNNIDYPTRVRMDSWYVRNWSLWLDIVMLFKTVRVVLKREGAY